MIKKESIKEEKSDETMETKKLKLLLKVKSLKQNINNACCSNNERNIFQNNKN